MTKSNTVKEKDPQLQKPKKYKVILLNDDFTPITFVAELVQKVFRKNLEEARAIAEAVHGNGSATCGIYTYEIAETKMGIVNATAHNHKHPLTAIIDPE